MLLGGLGEPWWAEEVPSRLISLESDARNPFIPTTTPSAGRTNTSVPPDPCLTYPYVSREEIPASRAVGRRRAKPGQSGLDKAQNAHRKPLGVLSTNFDIAPQVKRAGRTDPRNP